MNESSPYPWSQQDGLCRALRNPLLWSGTISDTGWRHQFKRMFKKTRRVRKTSPLYVTDDHHFGEMLVDILKSRAAREELFREFTRMFARPGTKAPKKFAAKLANWLHQYVLHTYREHLSDWKNACDNEKDSYFLNAQKFREWLKDRPLNDDVSKRAVVLLACSFAILQPSRAAEFRSALLERDPTLEPALSDDIEEKLPAASGEIDAPKGPPSDGPENSADPAQSVALPLLTESVAPPSGTESAPPQESLFPPPISTPAIPAPPISDPVAILVVPTMDDWGPGSDPSPSVPSDELIHLLVRYLDWRAQLPLTDVRRGLELLMDRYRKITKHVQDLDERRMRVLRQLDEVRRIPGLEGPVPVDLDDAIETLTIAAGLDRLAEIERDVTRVLSAHLTLDVLMERLGRRERLRVPRKQGDLAAVAEILEAHIEQAKEELQRISREESDAVEFLDRFSSADRHVSEALFRGASAQELAHLMLFLARRSPRTEVGKKHASVTGKPGMVGPLAAFLVHRAPEEALEVLRVILLDPGIELTREERADILSYLTFSDLQALAKVAPELSAELGELIFAAAFASNRTEALDYLKPILSSEALPPECAAIFRAAVDARRRGALVDMEAQLREALLPAFATPAAALGHDREGEDAKRHLLSLIDNTPGMSGNFHRMRVSARVEFFAPLRENIVADDIDGAVAKWKSYGSLDEMVDDCARSIGDHYTIDPLHRQQTRSYLATFQRDIERWSRSRRPEEPEAKLEVTSMLLRLRQDVSQGKSPAAAPLIGQLERLLKTSGGERPVLEAFGQRCDVDASGNLTLRVLLGEVPPIFTWSFSQAMAEGAVALWRFIADQLRTALGTGPATTAEAVKQLLADSGLQAAKRAAEGDAALEQEVSFVIEQRRATIRAENADTLAQAQAARVHDEYIDLWLRDLDDAFEGLELKKAALLVQELSDLVLRFNLKRDPARRAFAEFLDEAGVPFADSASTEDLKQQVTVIKSRNGGRRLHIEELEKAAAQEVFPLSLKESWAAFAQRIDRPSLWPGADLSRALADSIGIYTRFIKGKLRHRDTDPSTIDLLVRSLEGWIPVHIKEAVEAKGPEIPQVIELANEIDAFCPERRILQFLRASAQPSAVVPIASQEPAAADGSGRPARRPPRPPPPRSDILKPVESPDAARTIAEMRSFLRDLAGKEQAMSPPTKPDALRDAIRKRDWESARRIGAALVLSKEEPSKTRLSMNERAYAICLSQSWPTDDRAGRLKALHYACIATLDTTDLQYYMSGMIDDVVVRSLIAVANPDAPDDSNLGEPLANTLASLSEAASAPIFQWLSDLLDMGLGFTNEAGVSGAARLADRLWEGLRGIRDNAKPRCDLLHALYRMRHSDELRFLARSAKPLDDLIGQCINAFERAESDPEVRARTPQLAAAVREQAKHKPNTKPWTLLLARIGPVSGDAHALRCVIEADRVEEEDDGSITLPLRLIPSISEPPESLELELGGEKAMGPGGRLRFPLEDEILLKEKSVPVRVPKASLGASGEQIEIPYRITGKTILGNRIDIRSSWTARLDKMEPITPLQDDEIKTAWPGASGQPVTTGTNSFFGREREMKQIQSYIWASDRQQSAMLFGQRRIGKTSLLWQLVSEFPPRKGAATAAFLDVSALSAQPGSMSKSFFDLIVTALESDARNEPIRRELQRHLGRKPEIARIARGLSPSTSIFYALEGLVEKLAVQTRNEISRVVLFVDEFDRFVEPLLMGQQSEVETFMWGIRQIVQQSDKISLILAGSGLQRLFVDNYTAALFGSINQVEIGPFQWETDRVAIEQTFMPPQVRKRLCRDDLFGLLTRHAYELSGGHPYYLSMLGFCAAIASKGRRLTPLQLNRVVEDMIGGKIPSMGVKIDAVRFYAPIFETLKRVEPRARAIAKLLFAQIAQRTTTEYPWLSTAEAIDVSDLRGAGEAERLDALTILNREGAIELDHMAGIPRVRIRIPLTAAAVRENAVLIRQDATQELRASEEKAIA